MVLAVCLAGSTAVAVETAKQRFHDLFTELLGSSSDVSDAAAARWSTSVTGVGLLQPSSLKFPDVIT